MSTILVTGGTGFVGGRLALTLAAKHQVLVSSRKTLAPAVLQMHGVAGEVLHSSLLQKEQFPKGIDTVIHLAALNEWDCVAHPSEAIRVNIDETRLLLENAIVAGVRQFIYFSTAHIYGSPLKGLITEDTLPVPVHPYAITHKAAEDYIMAAGLQKKIQVIIIRLSNAFGAPVMPTVNRWTLLANDLARQSVEKGRLVLSSNGCQYRDFICLSDVENVVKQMTERANDFAHIIYNLGAGISMQVKDMAQAIADASNRLFGGGMTVQLPEGAIPTREPLLDYSIERLTRDGFVINNDMTAELERLLVFCRENFQRS